MLHFQRGTPNVRNFWHEVPATMGAATGTDLFMGRNAYGILARMHFEDIKVDYFIVDTVRVPRETFAAILEAWRAASGLGLQTIGVRTPADLCVRR